MKLEDKIPGLREAIARDRFERTAPFLGLSERICGVEVRPLTLMDVLRLDCIGSPFMVGGYVTAVDVGAFFKLQCTERGRLAKWWMLNRLAKRITLNEGKEAVEEFISDSFIEAPTCKNGNSISYWTIAQEYLHVFGATYGWPPDVTLNMPVKAMFAQLNVIIAANNPGAPLFNPHADKCRGQWLKSVNGRN